MKNQNKKNIYLVLISICFSLVINFSNILYASPNKQLNKKISEIKNNINTSTVNLKKYNKTINDLNYKINYANKKILEVNISINEISEKQKELNKELHELESNLKNNQEIIQTYLIIMHKHNNYPKLKLLLSKNIFNWSLLLNYLKYLNKYEKDKFDAILKQIEKITNVYNKIEQNKTTLHNKYQNLEIAKNHLFELQKQESILRDNIKKNIESNKMKLADLLNAINLENEKSNKKINTPHKNFKELKSKLIMPIEGNVLKFTEDTNEEKLTQNGIFIQKSENHKYIHSIYDGKVVFADWLKLYGNVVIIDHMNGYMSLYANNDKVTTKLGSFVQAGEQIAVIGNSGEFGQQGSYFELRYQGKPLNPIKWLKIG